MLVIASGPFTVTDRKILHVVFFRDKTNAVQRLSIQTMKGETNVTFRVGEHLTSPQWFTSFPTVIFHAVSPRYWSEYLQALRRYHVDTWISKALESHNQKLIFIGTTARMLMREPVLFGRQPMDNEHFTTTIVHPHGLGIVPFDFDIDYDTNSTDAIYARNIQAYSKRKSLYLLDPGVVITTTDNRQYRTSFGSLYCMKNAHLTPCVQFEPPITDEAIQRQQKRLLPS